MTFQGDIYARYQCYRNADEFAAAIRKSAPIKIDIGAVFNARPSGETCLVWFVAVGLCAHAYLSLITEHKSLPAPIVPEERELIFDIDLTDYDDVRKCCQKTSVCHKCFVFMSVAVKVLDDMLRNDFGFKHLLWVFSGRRGVHCWVCDSAARALTNVQRSAVADYISITMGKGGEEMELNTAITSNGEREAWARFLTFHSILPPSKQWEESRHTSATFPHNGQPCIHRSIVCTTSTCWIPLSASSWRTTSSLRTRQCSVCCCKTFPLMWQRP